VEQFEIIVSMLLGPLAYYLVQEIKKRTGIQGIAALWATFGVSAVLAAVTVFAVEGTGGFHLSDPIAFVTRLLSLMGTVFMVATMIYRYVKEDRASAS
jgi:cell shape-determining protein MreD